MATSSKTNTFATGGIVEAAEHNQNFDEIHTFLNDEVIHKDGTTTMTDDLVLATPDGSTPSSAAAQRAYVDSSVSTASTAAAAAQTTADDAHSDAAAAQSTADTAQTNALAAIGSAGTANSIAAAAGKLVANVTEASPPNAVASTTTMIQATWVADAAKFYMVCLKTGSWDANSTSTSAGSEPRIQLTTSGGDGSALGEMPLNNDQTGMFFSNLQSGLSGSITLLIRQLFRSNGSGATFAELIAEGPVHLWVIEFG